jgi:protein TonB
MEAKKTPEADLSKKSGMFLNLGLAISVGLCLFAFEYKSYDDRNLKDLGSVTDEFEELLDIPITEQPPPPPPPIEQPIIEQVADEIEIEEKIEVNFDVDVQEETVIKEVVIADAPVVEKADEIFDVVENSPEFPGGMEAWNEYLRKNLKYPTQARRMGIEGTVYVVFVVNTDGTVQDAKGCLRSSKMVSRQAKRSPGKG